MAKNPNSKAAKRKKRNETAQVIAQISGYSPSMVRKVMNGVRENKDILNATIIWEQGQNKLLQHIKKLVPFN